MSLENNIHPADILKTILDLPTMSAVYGSKQGLERARAALQNCPARAVYNRVVIYRYDGDGAGSALCDKVQTGLQSGTLPFHEICQKLNADLQLIELGGGVPTPADNARATAFGMMAAEEDTKLLVVAGFGAEASARKSTPDFFESTMPDVAAIFGAIVSAARAGIPVIVEGLKGFEAATALYTLRPDLCGNVFICGVPTKLQDPRFTIFADDTPDHPGFAGVALAALFRS